MICQTAQLFDEIDIRLLRIVKESSTQSTDEHTTAQRQSRISKSGGTVKSKACFGNFPFAIKVRFDLSKSHQLHFLQHRNLPRHQHCGPLLWNMRVLKIASDTDRIFAPEAQRCSLDQDAYAIIFRAIVLELLQFALKDFRSSNVQRQFFDGEGQILLHRNSLLLLRGKRSFVVLKHFLRVIHKSSCGEGFRFGVVLNIRNLSNEHTHNVESSRTNPELIPLHSFVRNRKIIQTQRGLHCFASFQRRCSAENDQQ